MTATDTKPQALKVLKARATKVDAARARLEDAMADRDRAIIAARQEGATYPELATATAMSEARVKQVLSAARTAGRLEN